MSKKSALTDDDQQFCVGVQNFLDDQKLSLDDLARMATARGVSLSKSSAFRLVKSRMVPASLKKVRPVIVQAFLAHLETKGLGTAAAETELTRILENKESENMIASRCPLSPEAIKFFGLKRDPFDVDHLPYGEEVFSNSQLDAVASRVRDGVKYQRFIAVVGGVGTGKTLLKLRVADELAEEGKSLLIYPEFFDMEEVTVSAIATQILTALEQKVPQDRTRRVNRIKDVLTGMQQEGISVAIIIDEAHRLHDRVISSFKNFWEMTNGKNSRLLGVLLFGQPSFVESRLRDVKFKEIRQRVQVIQMPELNGESVNYLRHRVTTHGGGNLDKLFDAESLRRICLNAATPLALGNLANAALMDAFENEEKHVTASLPFFKKLNSGQQVLGMRRSAA
jgi:type II secretory pathway predicted ATPase ExeA